MRLSNLLLALTLICHSARAADEPDFAPGELAPALAFEDLGGQTRRLRELCSERGLIVVLRDEACPLCQRYLPTLQALEKRWSEAGPRFLYVNPGDAMDAERLRRDRDRLQTTAPYVADVDGIIARSLDARSTTEVFFFDAQCTLIYRGAIDDQHAVGSSKEAPSENYLIAAEEAARHSERPRIERTDAPGCVLEIGTGARVRSEEVPTYHGSIERILARRCLDCHSAGGIAPFALATHPQVVRRKSTIARVVADGIMPPWGAAEGHGPWRNDFGLRRREKEALLAWIASDTPLGDPTMAPRALRTAQAEVDGEWKLGQPDLIVTIPREEKIKAAGKLDYRYQWAQTTLDEDRWVRAVEFRTTAPQVVHHVLTFLDEPPKNLREMGEKRRGGLNGYFAGLVPGQGPTVFPEGTGKCLPAGAWIKFQLHYTANGIETTDRTSMALWFHDDVPPHALVTTSANATRFEIPPGDSNYEVRAKTTFKAPAYLTAFSPHMHLRGKAFRYELELPDGTRQVLLDIPRYDFDWQIRYELAKPMLVPGQAVLHATAWFDNSASNPANPDPTRSVRFGEQTWDEMMIGYFEFWR